MAYETGSSSSANDLLDKLRAFLIANGWTQNQFSVVGSGTRLHVSKDGVFTNFRSFMNETISAENDLSFDDVDYYGIMCNCSDAYSGANLWGRQPGAPYYGTEYKGAALPNLVSAMPSYHFFTYPEIAEVHIVIEYISGSFMYLGFGALNKYNPTALGGVWFGGAGRDKTSIPNQYGVDYPGGAELLPFRGSQFGQSSYYSSSYIRVNIDSHDGWAGSGTTSGASPIIAVGPGGVDGWSEEGTVSPYLWQTQLLPYTIFINRSNIGLSPFGEIKHLRRLDITNYAALEEMTLGSDVWKIFPLYQKGGYSLQRGFAIRKVA